MGSVESTPSKEKERDEGKVLMVYDVKKGGGHVDRREAMKRFRCERLALREIGEEVEKGLNVCDPSTRSRIICSTMHVWISLKMSTIQERN